MLRDSSVILIEEISTLDCVTEERRVKEVKIFSIIIAILITNAKGRFGSWPSLLMYKTHMVSGSIDLIFLLTVQVLLMLG